MNIGLICPEGSLKHFTRNTMSSRLFQCIFVAQEIITEDNICDSMLDLLQVYYGCEQPRSRELETVAQLGVDQQQLGRDACANKVMGMRLSSK